MFHPTDVMENEVIVVRHLRRDYAACVVYRSKTQKFILTKYLPVKTENHLVEIPISEPLNSLFLPIRKWRIECHCVGARGG